MTNRTERLDELLRRIQMADACDSSSGLAMLGDFVRDEMKWEMETLIVRRALREIPTIADAMSLAMDLSSVDLDLERLLTAPPFDFAHDICGIIRHMDRTFWPGKLKNCFVPRYSKHP